MASAPLALEPEAPEIVETPEAAANDDAQQQAPRDYDAEARVRGWVPKDEWKGEPGRHVDAETFVRNAEEKLPLLQRENKNLVGRIARLEKDLKRMGEFAAGADKRALERLKAEQIAAVESGDVEAFKRVESEIEDIKARDAEPATQGDPDEAWDAFRDANPWYDKANLASASEIEVNARLYADRMAQKHTAKAKEMAPDAFFEMIAGLVKEKYPQIAEKAVRQKPASAVAGPTPRGGGVSGRSFADLPPEAQRFCDRMVRDGIIKDRAAYVKDYDWE
jgi:hypothetical protein